MKTEFIGPLVIVALIALVIVILFKTARIVPQRQAFIVERLGKYSKTLEAGFHILQLIERRGEYVNVRHMLMRPKVSPLDLAIAKVELDSIADLIDEEKYTFDEAVVEFSEDPSKNNGGLLINPMTGTSLFESDQLDPKVFFVIDKLEVSDISAPVQFQTEDGKDAYRLLYLIERTEPHQANLVQDYDKMQNWALEKKKQEGLEKWVNEKVENTYISIHDDYDGCEFSAEWLIK